jgi:hypothetical protein
LESVFLARVYLENVINRSLDYKLASPMGYSNYPVYYWARDYGKNVDNFMAYAIGGNTRLLVFLKFPMAEKNISFRN